MSRSRISFFGTAAAFFAIGPFAALNATGQSASPAPAAAGTEDFSAGWARWWAGDGERVGIVDGQERLRGTGPHPWTGGFAALRTYRTSLRWANIRPRPRPAPAANPSAQ